MNFTNESVTIEAPAMVCPICGKTFNDIHSYANHLTDHSQEEMKRKAEEEKKERENQRKNDIDNLLKLKAEYKAAEKKLETALNDYEEKYGGRIIPYVGNNDLAATINELFNIFF